MKSLQSILILSVIAFCCVNFGDSMKCYSCTDKSSCAKPSKIDCSQYWANSTMQYLAFHHLYVPTNYSDYRFLCFSETIDSRSGQYWYKGCIYAEINGCSYPLNPVHSNSNTTCRQCNSDYCNSAGQANFNVLLTMGALLVAMIAKQSMWN